MERPSTRDGSSTPLPTTPTIPTTPKRASTGSGDTMAPFDPVSSDRLNTPQHQPQPGSEKRHSIHTLVSPTRSTHSRDSSVSDKINQFNTLASQGKHLERKTADAALKRAMLGREEAEAEMRKYREEARTLRKQLDEGRDRERRVGERLEAVMEQYGRAKETHAHTQALWEKEIRRTRKETFKSQSAIVKLQEELKSARASQKSVQDTLDREKERSLNREQEAFQARYNLVGLQEQLDKNRSELEQALEKVKTLEQERDAFKSLAKTEEDVARIAAEGRLPLPAGTGEDEDDEFASPRKTNGSRAVSLSLLDIKSSAASEAEIDELTRMWQWEKQRADRAADQVEYLEAECSLRACSCMKKRPRSSMVGMLSPKRQKRELAPLADPSDRMILSEKATFPPTHEYNAHAVPQPTKKTNKTQPKEREERRATIFLPELGTFRTVSMEEAEALERAKEEKPEVQQETDESGDSPMKDAPAPVGLKEVPERYSRTPSVEPPSFALLGQERVSLVSLLNAPHQQAPHMGINTPTIPTTPAPVAVHAEQATAWSNARSEAQQPRSRIPLGRQDPNIELNQESNALKTSFNSRPHTAASFYTKTTTVPLREETAEPSMAKKLLALQKTPTRSHTAPELEMPTWDVNNPALTPTMTREEALAKIRERRGRAKSGNSGMVTPHKGLMKGRGDRRDLSAPAGRKGRMVS
ncbi:hypothetical protein VMCG_06922 [Cytospora schulzeri]|uniref:Uncharacterized protein n=1 Tax=Cytospora schulzeri TaxID=448051 RepID=A0A423W259_9PEZI|nr:hypothetical protein VMCG_06922 [Valsa malicola]